MYPNSALSAGQLALIAVVPMLMLAIWLISIFVAARGPRRRDTAAGATSPQSLSHLEKPQRITAEPYRKAA
jgi:hypothetical protein